MPCRPANASARCCCIAAAEDTPCRSHKHQRTDVGLLSDYRLLLGCVDASSERVGWIAMTIDDLRSNMDAASLGGQESGRYDGTIGLLPPLSWLLEHPHAPEPPPLSRTPASDRRVFFGPFFREKYGAGGDKALENSRIRYYGPVQPTSTGELKLASACTSLRSPPG